MPLILNTVEFALGGSCIAIVLGLAYAWIIVRTNVPFKGFLRLLPVFPMTLPLLVKSFAWVSLFTPRVGLINVGFQRLFGFNPGFNIFSMPGMIFAEAVGGVPLMFLLMEPAVSSLNPAQEESSRVCGAGSVRTFFSVTLPILRPVIFTALFLGIIFGIENFEYPLILGTPAHISTLATYVYDLVEVTQNYSLASAYGLVYLLVSVVLLSFYVYSSGKSFRYFTVTGTPVARSISSFGKWRWGLFVICMTIVGFAFLLPFVTILLMSLVPFFTATVANPFATLTLSNYYAAVSLPLFGNAVINSFEISLATAALATSIGALISYAVVKGGYRGRSVINYISALPLSFPPVVYSIGLIWMFLSTPFLNQVYGTNWVLLIGLTVVLLPYPIRFISSSLMNISDDLEESAAVCGSSWIGRFRRIIVPVTRLGLTNSFLYVVLNAFRELGAVALLSTSSSAMITVLILNLYESTAATFNIVAALSVIEVGFLALIIVAVSIVTRKRPVS